MFAEFTSPRQLDCWIHRYLELKREVGPVVFLDSQLESYTSSSFGYIASDPVRAIKARDGKIWYDEPVAIDVVKRKTVPDNDGRGHNESDSFSDRQLNRDYGTDARNTWDALQDYRDKYRDWMFGWLGYDLKNDIESLESKHSDPVALPDLFFFVPGTVLRIDRKSCKVHLVKGNPAVLNQSIGKSETPNPEPQHQSASKAPSKSETHLQSRNSFPIPTESHSYSHQHKIGDTGSTINKTFRIGQPESGLGWQSYRDKVLQIKERIARGDTYEVNLTHQLQAPFSGNSLDLFASMRKSGPVPFAVWMHYGDVEVCCSSPERFLQRQGTRIITQPIKGTSARGATPEEDRRIVKEILQKEKNRAENVMIVDLVRHDLGQVAQTGTVRTDSLLEVQTFSTVHQLVSTVSAELKPDTSSVDALKACFPMGSMTGAPKIRTMQIIEELENYRRGLYSGAIGYFTPEDNFDFNVVIRTAIIVYDRLYYAIGGAVTADSDPREEWDESWLKAEALLSVPDR